MAINLSSGAHSDEYEPQADINITPFIDVVLVLLIIFMVAAPLSTVDVPVELPVAAIPKQPRPEKPVFVTLKSDLSIVVGEQTIAQDQIARAIADAMQDKMDQRVFIRADKAVPYGDLMRLMDTLRGHGIMKVGLVTLEDASNAARP